MKRAIIAAAVVAVALIGLWRACKSGDRATRDDDERGAKSQKGPTRSLTGSRPAAQTDSLDLEYDVDRQGDLVLEGQVIDETEDPVPGALVTLQSNPRRTVTAGEDGTFSFDKLIGRSYTLVAQSESGAAGPVVAHLTADSEPVILRMRPAASLRVRVLDARSNEPIMSADVELRGVMRQRASTDANGVATLRGVPQGFYQLAASATGYAATFERVRVPPGDAPLAEEIRLRVGARVSGRVTDASGRPLEGARVIYRQGAAGWRQQADPQHDAVMTDRDGAFQFDALPAGGFYFQADHPGHARGFSETIDLDGVTERAGIEIRLDKGVTLAGRVLDGNRQPIPYAGVRVLVGTGRRGAGPPRQSFADDQGAFEIAGLPHDTVNILATTEDAASATVEVDLAAVEQKRVDLVVDRVSRIAGIVVDSAGEPVDGAQVSLRPDFQGGGGDRGARRGMRTEMRLRGRPSVLSDAGGRFEFTGLEARDYVVTAAPPGVSMDRRGRFRGDGGVPAKAGDTEVRVELEAMGAITGKVAFSDGASPASFTVATGGFRGAPRPFASKDGRFSIGDLAPDTYHLTVRGAEFDDKQMRDVEVPAGETVDVGTITVIKGRSVSGRVVTASGTPVANATVYVGRRLRGSGAEQGGDDGFGPFSGNTKSSTSDETGFYALRGLPQGILAIVAEHPAEGRSTAMELPVAQTAISDLDLTVVPPGAINGTVYQRGVAAASARVTAQSQTIPGLSYRVNTGPDGAYRFERLAPDKYLVSAGVDGNPRDGRGLYSEAAVVESGRTVQLDLRIEAGAIDLVVSLVPAQGTVGFARVHTAQGRLQARTALELEAALARRAGGFTAFGFSVRGAEVRVEGVPVGELSVCAVPFPADLGGPDQMRPYIERHGDELPAFCKTLVVAEQPDEQQVALPVTVPTPVQPGAE